MNNGQQNQNQSPPHIERLVLETRELVVVMKSEVDQLKENDQDKETRIRWLERVVVYGMGAFMVAREIFAHIWK